MELNFGIMGDAGERKIAPSAPFRLAGGNALPFAVAPDPATARALIAGCANRLERPEPAA